MEAPFQIKDRFLNPGEFYFGGPDLRLKTLLGSCVSIVLWHPTKFIGGMCHYLLTTRGDKKTESFSPDGKYGDEAFCLFMDAIRNANTKPTEYEAKIFGGADMFSREEKSIAGSHLETKAKLIGLRNVEFAKIKLKENSIKIVSENTGGSSSRKIFFTLWDGEVWLESHKEH
ncbi:chemotaxis protein [Leptospira idonii]|uniref:Probable chemoreceptor glutamine deamidase CheD n=2 Tax=Leptospira idonii TaxID=1193500 RepID=A0A4R9LYV6_9LEPT|nr:chemotaxis protein CheD [Leptospira idonii]TGN18801.1 chemotaxis protein [Leptospira idonii]